MAFERHSLLHSKSALQLRIVVNFLDQHLHRSLDSVTLKISLSPVSSLMGRINDSTWSQGRREGKTGLERKDAKLAVPSMNAVAAVAVPWTLQQYSSRLVL